MDHVKRTLSAIPVKAWLWMIIGLGVMARLGAVLMMGDAVQVLPGIYDQVSYHTLATRLLGGHGFTFETEWWPVTQAGEPTAHWSYLYTFYLTIVYALVGVHPLAARVVQAAVVGVMMPWVAFRLGTYLSPGPSPVGKGGERLKSLLRGERGDVLKSYLRGQGEWVGLAVAAWVAFYPYFIYYSAALMTEMFYITAILWSLEMAIRIAYSREYYTKKRNWGRFALLGLAVGTAVLLRQVYLAFVPFLLGWVVVAGDLSPSPSPTGEGSLNPSLSPRGKGGERLKSLLQFGGKGRGEKGKGVVIAGLVVIVMIVPFTVWNYQQFGRFVLLNTNAGYAFFWANHPVHGDDFVPLFTEEMPTYQELIPVELRNLDEAALDQALMARGMQFVIDDPGRYVRLSLSRIDDHFIFWPKADSTLLSNITRVASIGVALPFMVLGAALWKLQTWMRMGGKPVQRAGRVLAEPGGLLLLFFLVYVGVHLLSWAGIRYRLPADAVMLVFAAYALVWIYYKVTGQDAYTVPD